jgi:hypothetical protein
MTRREVVAPTPTTQTMMVIVLLDFFLCTIITVITLIIVWYVNLRLRCCCFLLYKKIEIYNFCRPTIADGSYGRNFHLSGVGR